MVSLCINNYSLRMLIGLLGIISTFMLIMISDNARDLLLNITALEFISQLDVIFIKLVAIDKVLMRSESSCNDNSNCVCETLPDICSFGFILSFGIIYLNEATSARVGARKQSKLSKQHVAITLLQ